MITDEDAIVAMKILMKYCMNNSGCQQNCILRKTNHNLCPIRTQGTEWNEDAKKLKEEALRLNAILAEKNNAMRNKIWCLKKKK